MDLRLDSFICVCHSLATTQSAAADEPGGFLVCDVRDRNCSQAGPKSPTQCWSRLCDELRRRADGMVMIPTQAEFNHFWTARGRGRLRVDEGDSFADFWLLFLEVWNSRESDEVDRLVIPVAERHGVQLFISRGRLEVRQGTPGEREVLRMRRIDEVVARIHEILAGPVAAFS